MSFRGSSMVDLPAGRQGGSRILRWINTMSME